jgi:hypothetical protein
MQHFVMTITRTFLFLAMLSLLGCGKEKNGEKSRKEKRDVFAGTWELVRVEPEDMISRRVGKTTTIMKQDEGYSVQWPNLDSFPAEAEADILVWDNPIFQGEHKFSRDGNMLKYTWESSVGRTQAWYKRAEEETRRAGDSGGSPRLSIASVRSMPGERILGQPTQKIVAEIRNSGRTSVDLFIFSRDGRKYNDYQLEFEKENTPGFKMPYGLGIEARYGDDERWLNPVSSHTWVPAGEPVDATNPVDQVRIGPGQSKSFSITMPAQGATLGAKSFRVFLLDPDLGRCDEKILTP